MPKINGKAGKVAARKASPRKAKAAQVDVVPMGAPVVNANGNGHNVRGLWRGDKQLVLIIDADALSIDRAPPTKSGKTKLLASTSGIARVLDAKGRALYVALNVMAPLRASA